MKYMIRPCSLLDTMKNISDRKLAFHLFCLNTPEDDISSQFSVPKNNLPGIMLLISESIQNVFRGPLILIYFIKSTYDHFYVNG